MSKSEFRDPAIVVLLRGLFWGSLMLSVHSTSAQPQEFSQTRFPDRDLRNLVVVGMLQGHDDYRATRIRISSREYVITPSHVEQPFDILNYSYEWLELKLKYTRVPADGHMDRVVFQFYQRERKLITDLILGRVDYAVLYTESQAREVQQGNPDFRPLPLRRPLNTPTLIVYNLDGPIVGNVEVRKAISYGINTQTMLERLLQGKGELAKGSPFESDRAYYPKGIDEYRYAPRRAKEILEDAGWSDIDKDGVLEKGTRKLRFRLAYEDGVELQEKVVRFIKTDLIPLGIDVIGVPLTKIVLSELLAQGNFDAVLTQQHFDESIEALYDFFANTDNSFIRFHDQRMEKVHALKDKTKDSPMNTILAQRMQVLLNQECVVTYLFYRWYDYHVFNVAKLDNFYDETRAEIRPFDEWKIISPK